MATTAPVRVEIPPDIADNERAMQQLRDGLANAATEAEKAAFDSLEDEHPSFFAWDELVDAAVASIAPQVAQMLEDAVAERLPWTWEAER